MKILLKVLTAIAMLSPLTCFQTASAQIVFENDSPIMKLTRDAMAGDDFDYAEAALLYQLHITDYGHLIVLFDEEYIEVPSLEAIYNYPRKLVIELKDDDDEIEIRDRYILKPLNKISHRVDW